MPYALMLLSPESLLKIESMSEFPMLVYSRLPEA